MKVFENSDVGLWAVKQLSYSNTCIVSAMLTFQVTESSLKGTKNGFNNLTSLQKLDFFVMLMLSLITVST